MAQYFTDFSGDTIGALPANTALKRNATAGDYTVQTDGSANVLRFLSSDSTINAEGLEYTPIASSGATEFYVDLRDADDSSPTSARLVVFSSDSPDNEYGVVLSSGDNKLEIYRRVGGEFQSISINTVAFFPGTYYKVRFQVIPGSPNILRARHWTGTTEPTTWGIDTTDGNRTLSGGWIGHIGFAQNDSVFYRAIGIGNNGDPAPTSPISSTTPALGTITATATTSNSISFSIPVSY